jgi:hypothetical protein
MVRRRRSFGTVRHLRSKNYQASYVGPDGQRHNAGHTFVVKTEAEAWLANERRYWDQLVADRQLARWESPESRTQADLRVLRRDLP